MREEIFKNGVAKSISTLSKIDEEKYLKSMHYNLMKDKEKAAEIQKKKQSESMTTKDMLEYQIKEKYDAWIKIKNEEVSYAALVKKSVSMAEEEKRQKEEEAKRQKLQYNMLLQKQILEQSKIKQFKSIMSEHEKKVNQKEIDAYMNSELQSYSKLPGIRNERIKYTPPRIKLSPPQLPERERENRLIETENQQYLNPQMIEMAKQYSKYSVPNRISYNKPHQHNERLIKLAEENMNDPLMEQGRNPTYNRAYGYFNKIK